MVGKKIRKSPLWFLPPGGKTFCLFLPSKMKQNWKDCQHLSPFIYVFLCSSCYSPALHYYFFFFFGKQLAIVLPDNGSPKMWLTDLWCCKAFHYWRDTQLSMQFLGQQHFDISPILMEMVQKYKRLTLLNVQMQCSSLWLGCPSLKQLKLVFKDFWHN